MPIIKERAEKAYPLLTPGNASAVQKLRSGYERGYTDAMQQRTEVTDAMLGLVVERCAPMLTLAEALSVIIAYERVRSEEGS